MTSSGIDRHAGPAKIEKVRQAPGRRVATTARGGVQLHPVRPRVAQPVRVVAGPHAHEHAGPAAGHALAYQPRILHGLPRHGQQQPLLRIQHLDLARRHLEEAGVEARHLAIVEKAPAPAGHPAPPARSTAVKGIDIEAAGRHLAQRLAARAQELPQRFRARDTAGQAAPYSDDGDWIHAVPSTHARHPGMARMSR